MDHGIDQHPRKVDHPVPQQNPDAAPAAEFTFAPLTPASFLERSARAFADRSAVVDGDRRLTYTNSTGGSGS